MPSRCCPVFQFYLETLLFLENKSFRFAAECFIISMRILLLLCFHIFPQTAHKKLLRLNYYKQPLGLSCDLVLPLFLLFPIKNRFMLPLFELLYSLADWLHHTDHVYCVGFNKYHSANHLIKLFSREHSSDRTFLIGMKNSSEKEKLS